MNIYFPTFALLAAATIAQASNSSDVPVDLFEGPEAAFVRCAVAASFSNPVHTGGCDSSEGVTSCSVVGGAHPAVMHAQWSGSNAVLWLKADDLPVMKWGRAFRTSAVEGEVDVYDEHYACSVWVTKDRRMVVSVRQK